MRHIISVDGGKGGVGKSYMACALIDYLEATGTPPIVVDADNCNPDTAKTYGHLRVVTPDMDTRDGVIALASILADAPEDYAVVNHPARSVGMQQHGQDVIQALADIGIRYTCLWVLSRQRDGIESLREYREALPDVRIIPVVNTYWGDTKKFGLWNDSKTRTEIMESNGNAEIIIPDCADRVAEAMRNGRLTWAQAADTMPFGEKIEVTRVRRELHTAIAQGGIL